MCDTSSKSNRAFWGRKRETNMARDSTEPQGRFG